MLTLLRKAWIHQPPLQVRVNNDRVWSLVLVWLYKLTLYSMGLGEYKLAPHIICNMLRILLVVSQEIKMHYFQYARRTCMSACQYVYIFVLVSVSLRVSVCLCIRVCIWMCVSVCAYICACISKCTYISACMYVCMYVCAFICPCICECAYVNID